MDVLFWAATSFYFLKLGRNLATIIVIFKKRLTTLITKLIKSTHYETH